MPLGWFALILALFVPDAFSAEKDIGLCLRPVMSEQAYAQRSNFLWLDHAELFIETPMQKFSGGFSVVTGKENEPVYLTETFLNAVSEPGVAPPLSGEKLTGHTYRYYLPSDSHSPSNGSGRDHLIQFGDRSLPDWERLRSIKGSGINDAFSRPGRMFALRDFRKNGLQELPESLGEQTMWKQYEQAGVPVIPHTDFIILPEKYQFALKGTQGPIDPRMVAVQTHRTLLGGRESQAQKAVSAENKARIVSSFYFWNIGHGALNPENLSAQGQIVDMGHTGFVNPIFFGQYRCTVCTGFDGSRADETLKGPLDHYYPERGWKASLDVYLSEGERQSIFDGMLDQLFSGGKRNPVGKLDSTELIHLKFLFEEQFVARMMNRVVFDTAKERQWLGAEILSELDRNLYGSPKANSARYFTAVVNSSMSPRFMMQLSALRSLYGEKYYAEKMLPTLTLFFGESLGEFETLSKLMLRAYRESGAGLAQFEKTLFTEYRPMNVVLHEVKESLRGAQDFSEINHRSKEAYARLSQPMKFTPDQWWTIMGGSLENVFRRFKIEE